MAKMSLQLSDGLDELRGRFEGYAKGQVLSSADARIYVKILRILHVMARNLEKEVSRDRWNSLARAERDASELAILAELSRPGTNVTAFPAMSRPFSDGQGGAA